MGITVVRLDVGDSVECDMCGVDWTHREESGGFLMSSYAVCPECASAVRESARKYGELHHIKAECGEGESFADFVRRIR